MANVKARKKTKKRAAVKDLKPKNVRNVKGGFTVTKTTDKSSPIFFQESTATTTTQK